MRRAVSDILVDRLGEGIGLLEHHADARRQWTPFPVHESKERSPRRREYLRLLNGCGTAARPRRHGVPEAQSLPHKSIYENVAYSPRIHGLATSKGDMDAVVERLLRQAGLWDEVKDRLQESGTALSGGQQQRLCIGQGHRRRSRGDPDGRALLGARSDRHCQDRELIHDLRGRYAIVIVTHNMQQAARVSQRTAFFHLRTLVEYGATSDIFTNPRQERTKDYITGRYG